MEVVSDNVCPWCFIGKRRLEEAMHSFADTKEFQVRWKPFQLNPNAAREGIDKRTFYREKFGEDRIKQMIPFMQDTFKKVGVKYTVDGLTGNTFDSHRLVAFAGRQGAAVQDRLVEQLFRSYFEEAKYVNDKQVLQEAADRAGVKDADQCINDDKVGREEVLEDLKSLPRGINGVPHFIINGKYHLSGAQEPSTFQQIFAKLG